MLMKPMETAAVEAVNVTVGRAQNGDGQKNATSPVANSHVITSGNGWPGIALPARHSPVATMPPTQCHLRSPLRSEDWPETNTPTMPHAK